MATLPDRLPPPASVPPGAAVLVLAHTSRVDPAVTAARRLGAARIDVLALGAGGADLPLPAGAHRLARPARSPRGALAALRRARMRPYAAVVVDVPDLARRDARGLVRALPLLLAGRAGLVVGDDGEARRDRPLAAAADAVGWLALQGMGAGVALVAAPLVERAARAPVARPPAVSGRVLYLRTDLDLRHRHVAAGGSVAHTEGVVDALEGRGLEVEPWLTGEVGSVTEGRAWRRLPALAPANVPEEVAALASGLLQGLLPLRGAAGASMVYQRAGLNALAGVLLARRLDAPLVTEFNLSEGELRARFGRLRHRRLSRACDRAVLRRSHLVSVVSEGVAEQARELGAVPERVLVLPNAVDVQPFATAAPAELPWPGSPYVVAFSGLFYPWHGAVHLAEAFARLHVERPDARLLLVGDGVDRSRADAVLERAGVQAAVHGTGSCRAPGCRACSRRPTCSARPTPTGPSSPARR